MKRPGEGVFHEPHPRKPVVATLDRPEEGIAQDRALERESEPEARARLAAAAQRTHRGGGRVHGLDVREDGAQLAAGVSRLGLEALDRRPQPPRGGKRRFGVRIRLHLLPPYTPHLNPIERLWEVLHQWITHNREHPSFAEFRARILQFLDEVNERRYEMKSYVTGRFRVITHHHLTLVDGSDRPVKILTLVYLIFSRKSTVQTRDEVPGSSFATDSYVEL